MRLVEGNEIFGGFEPSIRSLCVMARRLEVGVGWDAYDDDEPDAEAPLPVTLRRWIEGTAQIEDHVTIIGAATKPANELSLALHPFSDWSELASNWEREKHSDPPQIPGGMEPDARRARLYLENVYAQFASRPPSAWLRFMARGSEVGKREGWYLECRVPERVFSALAEDIVQGRCAGVQLRLKLEPPLTSDRYAPPSAKVTYGILGDESGGVVRGWVMDVTWRGRANAAE